MKTLDKNTERKSDNPLKTTKGIKEHMLVEDPRKHHLLNVNANGNTNPLIDSLIKAKEERVARGKELHVTLSSFSLCLSLALIIGMFELRFKDNGSLVNLASARSSFETLIEIPPTEQKAPPPPKLQSPKIIEVSDDELLNDIDIDLDIEITEDTKIAEVNYSDIGLAPPEEEKADEIFTIVEEKPEPAGGYSSFYEYVSKNLHYPGRAKQLGIEGRVFIQFVVEKDGSLTDIQVVKGVGGGCDEEAVRVISQAPKWNPGKQRGRPVRVRMILPVVFKLLN